MLVIPVMQIKHTKPQTPQSITHASYASWKPVANVVLGGLSLNFQVYYLCQWSGGGDEVHSQQVYMAPTWGAVNELEGCLSEGTRKAGGRSAVVPAGDCLAG